MLRLGNLPEVLTRERLERLALICLGIFEAPVKDSDWVYWGDYIIEVETIKPRSYATAVSIQGERIKGVSGDSGEMD